MNGAPVMGTPFLFVIRQHNCLTTDVKQLRMAEDYLAA